MLVTCDVRLFVLRKERRRWRFDRSKRRWVNSRGRMKWRICLEVRERCLRSWQSDCVRLGSGV